MISPETLRYYPLFAGQNAEMLKQIALLADEKEVREGGRLFFEGEIANTLCLIEEGTVSLTMNLGEHGERRIEKLDPLGKGEVIGWSTLVEPHEYTMGATAEEQTRYLAFDGQALRELLDDNPEAGYYLYKKLAEVMGHRLVSKCVQIMSLMI